MSLLELRDEPFVLFSRRASPDYHTRIVEMCGALGFQPKVRHEARHWLSVVALVAQGMGVSVVPAPLQRSGISGALFVGGGIFACQYSVWLCAGLVVLGAFMLFEAFRGWCTSWRWR